MAFPKHAPGTFCWFECGSKHKAKSKAFYTQLFGWESTETSMPENSGTYTLFETGGEPIAGLYELVGPRFENMPSHWATYVAVEDVDDTLRRAESLGGQVMLEGMDIPNVGRIGFLQDPTGAMIGVARFDQHPGTSDKGPFGWSELATRDTARAKAFYTELFGWTAKPDPKNPYTEFQVGGRSIAGMMAMTPQHGDAPAHWLPYVMVDDCDRIARQVNELGGHTLVPPMDIEKVGRFTIFADPAGAGLAVIKLTHHLG
jgi:predicted enzyme related to lactoylglutathione lyase